MLAEYHDHRNCTYLSIEQSRDTLMFGSDAASLAMTNAVCVLMLFLVSGGCVDAINSAINNNKNVTI